MELSRYTFNFLDDNLENYILYNSRSNNMLLINRGSYDNIVCFLYDALKYSLNEKENKIFGKLHDGGFIIDSDRDEIQEIACEIERAKYTDKRLVLSIAITEDCNLKCKYCFVPKQKSVFSRDNIISLKSFIGDYVEVYKPKEIQVTWYGGEPLLAMGEIEETTNEILKITKKRDMGYSASLITNGTLLKENFQLLRQCDVSYMQVSLEPSKQINDVLRPFKSGAPSFDIIYNNVKEVAGEIPINLRIALSKKNSDYVYDFVKKLEGDNLFSKKVSFSLGPLHGLASKDYCLDYTYNSKEYSDVFFGIYERLLDSGIIDYALYPLTRLLCGATKNNVFSISSTGDIYKCFEHIGDKRHSMGNISQKFNWNKNLSDWLYLNPAREGECGECRILPICNGGCYATRKHQDESNVGLFRDQKCSIWKYNLEKGLKLYLKSKKLKGGK